MFGLTGVTDLSQIFIHIYNSKNFGISKKDLKINFKTQGFFSSDSVKVGFLVTFFIFGDGKIELLEMCSTKVRRKWVVL